MSAAAAPAVFGTSAAASDDPLGDSRAMEQIRAELLRLAWSRYRMDREEAEDVVQTAFATYFQIRGRYSRVVDHAAFLCGIFRHKCLKHIEGATGERKRMRRYCSTPYAARENQWIRPDRPGQAPSVLDALVRDETRGDILRAVARLRPSARRLVAMVAFSRMGRQDLIRELGLNKNTLDSRLHACRAELRRLLTGNELGSWRRRCIARRAADAAGAAPRGALRLVRTAAASQAQT